MMIILPVLAAAVWTALWIGTLIFVERKVPCNDPQFAAIFVLTLVGYGSVVISALQYIHDKLIM